MKKKLCPGFVPFRLAGDVCEHCGELVADHAGPVGPEVGSDYQRALWRVLLEHGGIYNTYTAEVDRFWSGVLRLHLGIAVPSRYFTEGNWRTPGPEHIGRTDCAIDWRRTGMPVMGEVSQFEDSFTENTEIPAVVGYLTCRCGKYCSETVALKEKTMGQLIWLVTRDDAPQWGR